MKSYKQLITEKITRSEMHKLQVELSTMLKDSSVKFELSNHLFERMNSDRNEGEITIRELKNLFKKTKEKHLKRFLNEKPGFEGAIQDTNTYVNVGFITDISRDQTHIIVKMRTTIRKFSFNQTGTLLKV